MKRKSTRKFLKEKSRKFKKTKRKSGWFRYYFAVIRMAKLKGKTLYKSDLPRFDICTIHNHFNPPPPPYSQNIQFLANNKAAFSRKALTLPEDGIFKIPVSFSLTENYSESFLFIKQLFTALYSDKFDEIVLDYKGCMRIDVDASVCMDTLVMEFYKHYRSCESRGVAYKLQRIRPINFDRDSVYKILTSIGAFKNIGGIEIKHDDIFAFPLLVGNNYSTSKGRDKEIEVTKIVDYIVDSLALMKRTLTWEAEDSLSKVVGEVLINAAEHSGNKYRYSIGLFQHSKEGELSMHVGIFNLVIFDFGKTIYENFKQLESSKLEVVHRMKELSKRYTDNSWFKEKQFEEETLWTLYALQEGVTSIKGKKRGNGSIHFIESFFNLKGNNHKDNTSFLTIISGNTRITFDGKYEICEKPRGKEGHLYKMMTFNKSGNIEERPDSNYVSYTENNFPGTMIVAKISINSNNIEKDGFHDDN